MANKKNIKETAEKANNKFDFSDSIQAIKETAKSVNAQVTQATGEVLEDLRENGEQLVEMTVNPMKEVYEKAYNRVTEVINVEKISEAGKNANVYALKTAEEVVDGVLTNTEKWQGVATKAVKGGLKLAAKQQEMVFDTLEVVKGQLGDSVVRLRKLFSNN